MILVVRDSDYDSDEIVAMLELVTYEPVESLAQRYRQHVASLDSPIILPARLRPSINAAGFADWLIHAGHARTVPAVRADFFGAGIRGISIDVAELP